MAAFTTIDDPSAYFKVQLYTGNGGASHAITFDDTDTDMQPDLVWIKNRDATDAPCLFDVTRGATKVIISSYTNGTTPAEATDADTLDSFASDGFQVDADVKVNTSSEKYVAWCWNTQGGAGSANTDGDINTTTTSVGTTQGFSISTYQASGTNGNTLGHGLGAVPGLYIIKNRDTTDNWRVYHSGNTSAPETEFLGLNVANATEDDAGMTNDVAPTSSVVSLGSMVELNTSGENYVMYAWAPKSGYSRFGSYEGNGHAAIAAGGTFVYTGFRPAFVMTKSIDSSSDWEIFDNKREGYNVDNDHLAGNTTAVEATTDMIDLLSNGFKLRTSSDPNIAETYIYAAFAEAPFVNSNGVPCNAR